MEPKTVQKKEENVVAARRRFLANCGKFAVVTPPVVSLMLAASNRNYAAAVSGNGRGPQGNNGIGNGGGDGVPGNSGFPDGNR